MNHGTPARRATGGSYELTVTAIVNGKRVRQSVGFDVTTCGFNRAIVVNF